MTVFLPSPLIILNPPTNSFPFSLKPIKHLSLTTLTDANPLSLQFGGETKPVEQACSSYVVWHSTVENKSMAGQAAKSVAKAIGEYQYPWREKLVKYKTELSKGVWGYWHLGAWKSSGISARHRGRLRKEVLLAGQDWPYDPERKEMRTKRKGHKVDRIAAEKRENTAKLMEKMPEMLLQYKKRRWEKKMKEEDKGKP